MRQNMADINPAEDIVDLGDQPVLVSFDIENRPLANGVRARKSLSDFRQVPPQSLLRNAKPRVERAFQVTVPCSRFLKLPAADDMHAAPRKFALCEYYTSQSAKMSRAFWFTKNNLERVNPRHARPDDQRVDIVRALVGLHRFQIHQVPHDGVIVGYAICSQNISR